MGKGLSEMQKMMLDELKGGKWINKREFVQRIKVKLYPDLYTEVRNFDFTLSVKPRIYKRFHEYGPDKGVRIIERGKGEIDMTESEHGKKYNAVSATISRAINRLIDRGLVEQVMVSYTRDSEYALNSHRYDGYPLPPGFEPKPGKWKIRSRA